MKPNIHKKISNNVHTNFIHKSQKLEITQMHINGHLMAMDIQNGLTSCGMLIYWNTA